MPDDNNPDGQKTETSNDQTDYKTQFLELSAKIANGEYVAKNVYTGLQTKHEKEVLAHKADVDALTTANQKATELDGALKTLQGQFGELKTTHEKASTDLLSEQATNKRLKLIMEKFPGLVSFEGQGLLPTATSDEELVTKLTKFQELQGNIRQQKKEDDIAGTSPTPGSKNQQQPPVAQALLDEARGLQRAGKFAEYNQKMDEYYKAVKQPA